MRLLDTITSKRENYTANIIEDDDDSIFFFGDMDVDVDGSPEWAQDPDGSSQTSLHYQGKPIDTSVVRGIVLPPECIKLVRPMVLGCKAEVQVGGGEVFDAVVFDIGPHYKLGEASGALALAVGANPSPTKGGIDEQKVLYRFWPGIPAWVDGVRYQLQPYE